MPNDITELLQAHTTGDAGALEQLLPRVYEELRRIARGRLRRERANHTLAATDLVHQAFFKLILAGLHHPNIARLLDGGVTDNGRPYLVPEYVAGLPLTTYCDRHRLGIEERLRLFVDICEAVQHAHQNLVIHRDLKPSNILVTADARVHLLDFSIAKQSTPTVGNPSGR